MENQPETIRLLHAGDIPAAMELSATAGWNQTAEDWRALLSLNPESCFATEIGGTLAATTTLHCYGRRLGWIGMVLTKPEFRRRGAARRLLTRALDRAREMGIETVKLDATDQGQPLYESLGFHAEQTVERWSRPGFSVASPANLISTAVVSCSEGDWQKYDLEAFGADRSPVLRLLLERGPSFAAVGSYLFSRPGRVSSYLGPCVAMSRESARILIEQCIHSIPAANWAWDLFPENRNAAEIAAELGFSRQRRLLRMVRGRDLPDKADRIYAIGGFELG
jgi:GNAT superfamily N-acetyltransferase